jgi:soluble lytic murein transglycosylase-like protein
VAKPAAGVRLGGALAVLLLARVPALPAATTERPNDELRSLLIRAINHADSFEDRYDAEVWLMDMTTRLQPLVDDSGERLEILRLAHAEARRNNLQPELVLAVIQVESRFDRFAISRTGAQGLMQIMPFWLEEIGRPQDNLFHIQTNLRLGCTILRYYLDAEHGNLTRALARYNGSLGETWYPQRVFTALHDTWYKR